MLIVVETVEVYKISVMLIWFDIYTKTNTPGQLSILVEGNTTNKYLNLQVDNL